jgi:hypothetical protein
MKFVKCIKNSEDGYPSIRGKIYKVLREDNHYYLHSVHKYGEMKSRFVEVQLNEKIAKILYS